MLYDLYRTENGIYLIVGPYSSGGDGEVTARGYQDAHGEKYLWTVNDPREAHAAAAEDHAETGGTGGIITRTATVEQVGEVLG